MRTIATLGPSVRLVVFQFLMKNELVPKIIPPKRASSAPPLPPVSGVEVLEATPGLNIYPLVSKTVSGKEYELVDVWEKPHDTNWNMSFVRFVYCRREYVNREKLHPDFVAERDELTKVLTDLVSQNLWATQGHLNPYLEKDGLKTGHDVLMLGSAGRKPNTEVFKYGRDKNNRGVGPKVLLSTLARGVDLTNGQVVVLTAPDSEFDTALVG